ncbi:uncharacterized protein LOC142250060 [Anomaloglossus baeobatrachus]|uniref:uncharacterized protein LOC142250060 n=1 Tax=Anomaloglossus baeobatrachus TaxID=238106 RepID=UPI003F4FC767
MDRHKQGSAVRISPQVDVVFLLRKSFILQRTPRGLLGRASPLFGRNTSSRLDDWLRSRPTRRHRFCLHPLISKRHVKGHFSRLYADLRQHSEKFYKYTRMSISTYDILLAELRPNITFQKTRFRKCVSAEERLLVTIRFLSTGLSYSALHLEFLLGIQTISRIVRHTCGQIWQQLKDKVMPVPSTEDWIHISNKMYALTGFPNCLGAVDGKHIRVKKPPNSGDDAFQLSTHVLKPYSRRNITEERKEFNFRLSRARRLVECAFGILPAIRPVEDSSNDHTESLILICLDFLKLIHQRSPSSIKASFSGTEGKLK